ncbi:outer membrane usher protein [Salmonella enterica subsp. enterica]|uniref:Outer membrane usher protein n=1 Tax=Salmonella enterica I TaxID=59201 RepID=A0A379WYE2_SALET|nr:outer membrane usher protein [Salmonella enterica subsp. enterica]
MPCFTPEWIKRLGVNTAAFPVSDKGVDTTCIHLPEKIPGAEVAFDFASMRLNISLPQASLLNSARGYIPPKSGMKGYLPHSLITVLPVAAEQTAIAIFESAERLNYGPWRCVITEPGTIRKGRLSFATLEQHWHLGTARHHSAKKRTVMGTAIPGTMFSTASAFASAAVLF